MEKQNKKNSSQTKLCSQLVADWLLAGKISYGLRVWETCLKVLLVSTLYKLTLGQLQLSENKKSSQNMEALNRCGRYWITHSNKLGISEGFAVRTRFSSSIKYLQMSLNKKSSQDMEALNRCGRYWIRTSDPLGVNQVL